MQPSKHQNVQEVSEQLATLRRRVIPPIWFLFAIVVMVGLNHWLPVVRWASAPWNLAGGVLIVAGIDIAIMGNRQFKRHGTPVRVFELTTALVTDGIFRYSRNPMYLGMVAVLVGIGIYLGSATPFVIVPLFIWLLAARFIYWEERFLAEQFGAAYLQYKKNGAPLAIDWRSRGGNEAQGNCGDRPDAKNYRYVLIEPTARNFHPAFRPELTPGQMLGLGCSVVLPFSTSSLNRWLS